MKMKSIPGDKYLELKHPEYTYIHIIPHKGIKGTPSKSMARTIAQTYQSIDKRLKKEKKKLFFETDFKISYIVDITKHSTSFYFMVPKPFVNTIATQITNIWDKTTIEVLSDGIKPFKDDSDIYELSYKKVDSLSLNVDSQNYEPLSSILGVIDIMQDDDRVGICYNFMPAPQKGWSDRYEEDIKKIKSGKVADKFEFNLSTLGRGVLALLLGTIDSVISCISEFLVGENNSKDISLYDALMGALNDKVELSNHSKSKRNGVVLQTQIAVVSSSNSRERQTENALTVCQAYNTIDGDNELKYKKIATKKFDLSKRSLGLKSSMFSTDEVSNFIQLPGKTLLDNYRINHVKTNESVVPEQLQFGKKIIGDVTYKGEVTTAYIEDDYNIGNLPMCFIGSQGSGKTTLFKNYARDCNKAGESVFVIDFIKDCELSDSIKEAIPSKDLVELDLSLQDDIQGFGFNEIVIEDSMSDFDKLKLANLQAIQTMALVDSMNADSPLTARMRRYLNAAANVVFVQQNNSIKSVIQCLEDCSKRENFISSLTPTQRSYLEDEIRALEELDEYSKGSKDSPPEKIGTSSHKVEHILDRIALLREDFKLKFMYNTSLKNNIDFVKCMDEGKTVLLKMKESEFPTKTHKNVLVTYFVSKLWLASQLRGSKFSQPSRCNVIIDEVFQAPTCMQQLEYILPQSRKFGLKMLFSLQYANQLKSIFDSLEASGASFLLLTGCTQEDFNRFKDKLAVFQFDDLRDMPRFHAMCLIKYSEGYASFIAKLPPPPKK